MELTELKDRICREFSGNPEELNRILEIVDQDEAIFPFNQFEHLICHLLGTGTLTFRQYLDLRNDYISENPNLWLFEISAPRGFGEKFAQTYVMGKCAALKTASKKTTPGFSGEYDLCLDNIRIEVKASRAVDSTSNEPLYVKALSRNTDRPFLMNFQQLKPQCCDVFVWVAVFRDDIVIWVLSSQDVRGHARFSGGQHRGNNGNEGQLHVRQDNIHLLDEFMLGNADLEQAIRRAAARV